MAVAILFFKKDNTIQGFVSDVIELKHQRIEFTDGYLEGWDETEIGVVIVDTMAVKQEDVKWLEDIDGKVFNHGDTLPTGLADISNRFIKKTLEQENAELKASIADLWEVVLMGGGV